MTAVTRALQGRTLQHLSCCCQRAADFGDSVRLLPAMHTDLLRRRAMLPAGSLRLDRRRWLRTSCSAGEVKQVEPPDVADLAIRARLEVSPEEIKDWTPKIGKIIDWFGQLQEINVEGVPPALRASGERIGNTVQVDEAKLFNNRDALWDAVPSKEGPYIRVPKILNESTE